MRRDSTLARHWPIGAFSLMFLGACGDSEPEVCPLGAETCDCRPDGECDESLVCSSNLCVKRLTPEPTGDGGSGQDAGGTSSGGTSGEETSGGSDASSDAGGTSSNTTGSTTSGMGTAMGMGAMTATAAGTGGTSTSVCAECTGATPHCDMERNRCVACLESSHCGGGACNTASNVCEDRFVGTWRFTSGTEVFDCDDGSPTTETPSGQILIQPGESSGSLSINRSLVSGSDDCVVSFNVTGDTATLVPRSCNETVPPTDLRRLMQFVSWTMVSADGQTLQLADTHTIALSGDPLVCTSTITATLERLWYETVAESEPNDFQSPNGPYDRSVVVKGAIDPSGDDDFFGITNSGTAPVSVRMQTHGSGVGVCDADTVLLLVDEAGEVIDENDDTVGVCSRLTHTLAPGETRYVVVIGYQDAEFIPQYHLELDFAE